MLSWFRTLFAPAPLRQERFGKPVALIGGEPCGIGRPIGQIEEDDAGENDGGDGLDDEKPLPTGKAEPAMEIEQQAGNRGADHGGKRNGSHEIADDTRAVLGRKPQRQIEDDARKEARLRSAKQGSQEIEGVLVAESGGAQCRE